MKVLFSNSFARAFQNTPQKAQREFGKQLKFLLKNISRHSLRAKKYDESLHIWQARVNKEWRFYFRINGDVYEIINIISHPK